MIKIKDGDCEFCGKENCNCYAIKCELKQYHYICLDCNKKRKKK